MAEDEITSTQKFKLRKLLKEIEGYRARHTELVTVYVPAGYDLNNIIRMLQEEIGTASNIKSSGTRKNVVDALEKMVQHLRLYKKTPENGLALYSGNVSEREGRSDVQVWSIEPPIPLKIKLYKCDQIFHIDPMKQQMTPKSSYGLIVIDNREANLAYLKGKSIISIANLTSMVPGKIKAGGQSAARYARIREGSIKEFYKKIAEVANKEFDKPDVKGIIVGGPGPTKESFEKGSFLSHAVKKKVIGIKNIGYTGEFGLKELVEQSEDLLAQEELIKERILMQKLLEYMKIKPNMVAYGEKEVKRSLDAGAVATLLISESVNDIKADEFLELNDRFNGETLIVSSETKEGSQLEGIGGMAAILRYPM